MKYDCIVIGSGIGGLSSAAILAHQGWRVLVLEANYLPGGCASSYPVKKNHQTFWLETGATTLVGKDFNQPLDLLQKQLNITLPGIETSPAMQVHMNGLNVTRFKDRDAWVEECYRKFFKNANISKRNVSGFWEEVYKLADFVWDVSGKNMAFPPLNLGDVFNLISNNKVSDVAKLRFLFQSTQSRLDAYGLSHNAEFIRFCNEQLRITAQSDVANTSFLYAAPCLSYANITNYYVYGGMIELSKALISALEANQGKILYRKKVRSIDKMGKVFNVETDESEVYKSRTVISNATVWDMAEITNGRARSFFKMRSEKYDFAYGAFTMGLVLKRVINPQPPYHHQVILTGPIVHCLSHSFFVSFSKPDDTYRHPEGYQILSISTHVDPEFWFGLNEKYDECKEQTANEILGHLKNIFPDFNEKDVVVIHTSTPRSWQNWVHRKHGRVGGLPNIFSKNPLCSPQTRTPFEGLYLVGDTVYPGQGIAGVTLSGMAAAYHLLK